MKPAHPKPGVLRDSLFAFLIVVGSAAPYLGPVERGSPSEMHLALIGMALAVLVGGAGAHAIDRWLHPW